VSDPYDNTQDQELLRAWEQWQDETAFRELVGRHLGMVHATALRRTGSAEMARDVSMGVFALLARRAASIRRHPCLAGWLHRAAYLEASNALRRELKHSRIMAALSDPAFATPEAEEGDALLEAAAPHLDEVLERLSPADRDAVMLRYTERLSYEAMSARLGKSADACQKQTSRALEKLSAMLLRRGVALSAAAAGSAVTAGTAKAAPALLAGKIAAGALQNAAGVSTLTIFQHTFHAMNTGKQIAAGALLAASLAAFPLLLQQSEASALWHQAETPPGVRQALTAATRETARNTPPPKVPADFTRTHPSAGAAEAESTLRMIAALDGRQYSTHELLDLLSRILDLSVDYMPRTLERIQAMKTALIQPALVMALFARWGELDSQGALAAMGRPDFAKLHPYASEIAQTGIQLGMLETDPRALLKNSGTLDAEIRTVGSSTATRMPIGTTKFLASGLPNMEPALAREFLDRMPPRDRGRAELEMLMRSDPDHFETSAAALLDRVRATTDGNDAPVLHDLALKAGVLLAERDPQRALEFAFSLKGAPDETVSAGHAALTAWSEYDAPAALAWLNSQSVERQREMLSGVGPALQTLDPAALQEFAAAGPEGLRADRLLAGTLALAAHDPAAAVQFAAEAPPENRDRTWDMIANTWAEQDKVKASEWIDALPEGADRNSAITGFTRHLVWEDGESAMIWAESISDPAVRDKVVESRIQAWLVTNRPAATAWLEKSNTLPPEKEQVILNKRPEELQRER
jgi:RNA polymerase sigma factor (sigma-70 family)